MATMEAQHDSPSQFPGPSLPDAEMLTQITCLQMENDWEIRVATAKVLGQRGDLRAVEPLCSVLTDKNWRVRIAAVGALGRLKDQRSVEALCQTLQDEEWYIRIATITALRQLGDTRAVPLLCLALLDTEAPVRSAAAEALGQLGDVGAIQFLCCALKDKEPDVRLSAGQALDSMGTADTLPLRVLSAMTLPPASLLSTLQTLAAASPRIMNSGPTPRPRRRPTGYRIGNVQTFCEELSRRSDVEESIRRNAEAVLAELQNRATSGILLRASMRNDTQEKAELLRGAPGLSSPTPPDELLRAAESAVEPPIIERSGLLARIFRKK
jgi:hypothetical protein